MKKNFTLMFMAAALTLGVTGCSKDDAAGIDVPKGEEATLSLNLSFPKTYAADANATADETAVNQVDVFILDDATGDIVTHKNLTGSDLTGNASTNEWKVTVKTTSGDRKILVGVNLPSSISSVIAQNGLAGADNNTVHEIVYGLLNNVTAGFAMFSTKVEEVEIHSNEDIEADPLLNNDFSVDVTRMVAKVGVQKAGTIDVTGVTGGTIDLSSLEFTLGNVNKKTYAMQYVNAAGIVEDPNYLSAYFPGTYNQTDFYRPSETGAFLPISASGTANKDLNAKYAPENVADLALRGTATYLLVKAEFTPDAYCDQSGAIDPLKTPTAGDSFWAVTAGGSIKFFDDQIDAATYAGSSGGVRSEEYVNGICYYRAYLGSRDDFNFFRNNFYAVTISQINSIGDPDPDDDGSDDDDPVDETDLGTINIDINIVEWNMELYNEVLGK